MKTRRHKVCTECGAETNGKGFKKINKKWRCGDCHRKKWKVHREYLKRDVLGIRKREDLLREWRKKRELREKILGETRQPKHTPKIKGSTIKIKQVSRQLHFYFTLEEKQFLFKKYQLRGLDYDSIKKRIKEDMDYLKNFMKDAEKQKKSEEEISREFKEEYAKLIMKE